MLRWFVRTLLLIVVTSAPAAAQEARTPWPWAGGTWRAGAILDIGGGLDGPVRAAGARVTVRDAVRGDLVAAGAVVTLRGRVTGLTRAAGARVDLDGQFEDSLDAAGAIVTLSERAIVADRLRIAAAEIEIDGQVGGNASLAGASVTIAGTIDGDVEINAASIDILASARIGGRVIYRSPERARIATGAEIAGEVVRETMPASGPMADMMRGAMATASWLLRAGLFVLGLVLIALFPATSLAAARTVGTRPLATLGLGLAVLIVTPVVAAVLACTLVGLPIAVVLLAGFALSLAAAWIVAALWLGDGVLRLAWENGGFLRRTTALLIGLVVLGLMRNTPMIRDAALPVVLVVGLGALWLELRRRHRAA